MMLHNFNSLKMNILSALLLIGFVLGSGTIKAQTSITLLGKDTICSMDSIMAIATSTRVSGVTYMWSDTLGNTTDIQIVSNDTVWLKPSSTTVFRVIADSSGVKDTTVQALTVNQTPTLQFTASKNTVCSGDTIVLKGTGADNHTYYRGSSIVGSGDSAIAIVTKDDTFSLVGITAGCESSATQIVTSLELPKASFELYTNGYPSSTFYVCVDQEFTLAVTSSFASYKWNSTSSIIGSDTDSIITGKTTQSANYNLLVEGTNGCSTTAVQLVRTLGQPSGYVTLDLTGTTVNDTVLCGGETRSAVATRCDFYKWSPASAIQGGNTTSASVVLSPSVNTTVKVEGFYRGCITSAEINLVVSPLSTLTYVGQTSSPSNMLCKGVGDTVEIMSNSSRIQWNTIISPKTKKIFTFFETTSFKITAFNDLDCETEITVTSYVDTSCGGLSTGELLEKDILAFYSSTENQMVFSTAKELRNATVLAYDFSGQEVFNSSIELPINSSTQFDFSSLPNGAYFFKVISPTVSFSKKFIKN